MGFFTTLHFYRPSNPPVITGLILAEFLRAFSSLQASDGKRSLATDVKFGKAIDQDEKPTTWEAPTSTPGVTTYEGIEWDLSINCQSLDEQATALAQHDRPIYRASLQIGTVTNYHSLQRLNSPDNEVDLTLSSWSLEIGPVMSSGLESDTPFFVGWISVNISGYGYLFPWTPAELVERADAHPGVRRVMELCRATWPVKAEPPTRRQLDVRRQMGDLWPYKQIDVPWDWYWGIQESG